MLPLHFVTTSGSFSSTGGFGGVTVPEPEFDVESVGFVLSAGLELSPGFTISLEFVVSSGLLLCGLLLSLGVVVSCELCV